MAAPGLLTALARIVPGSYFNTLTGAYRRRSRLTILVSGGAAVFPGNGAYGGQQLGDIVGNLRVDQAWGGAQIMGALHELNPTYYSGDVERRSFDPQRRQPW